MKFHIVCIRDRKSEAYGTPNFVAATGAAIRSFGDEVNRVAENNVLNQHPEDFDLYYLGMYDDSVAGFELGQQPKLLATGTDMLVPRN